MQQSKTKQTMKKAIKVISISIILAGAGYFSFSYFSETGSVEISFSDSTKVDTTKVAAIDTTTQDTVKLHQ